MDDHSRYITGQGRYIADDVPEGAAHMVVVRAEVAHGKLNGVETDAARAMPGVLDILTADVLSAEGVGSLRSGAQVTSTDGTAMLEAQRPVLATGKVVHLGQPVAVVIAETAAQALAAAEAVVPDIEDIAPVLDPATAQSAPPIWSAIPANRAFHWQKGNAADTKAAFARADLVIEQKVVHPRMSVAPVETRGCIAHHSGGEYTLVTGSQGVMGIRRDVAACLGIDAGALRVITRDVGGSFAVKIWAYPEHVLALVAARRTGRDVAWLSTRAESLASDAAGRGRVDTGALAVTAAGDIIGFRIDAVADMGAFLNAVAPYVATGGAVRPFGQCYDIPAMLYTVDAVYTNAPPTDAYRGAGKPESAATLERLIDLAARKLGMDPFDLRRRNLVRPDQLPYATPMGETYDSGDFPALADALRTASDYDGFASRDRTGVRRGRAVGFHLHATGGSTAERTEIRALKDGDLLVRTGTQDSGQGHKVALAAVAAAAFGVPVNRIRVEQGDSAVLEIGGGTGGSCLMPIAANTVKRAADKLIAESLSQAAILLEASVQDVEYDAGRFRITGTDRSVGWAELVADDDDMPSCATTVDFEGLHTTFPNGGYVVEVALDPETGQVAVERFTGITDAGVVVSEAGALGQIEGGIVQALGEVMLEELVHSGDGQLVSGSLMDYALPRADHVPHLDLSFRPTDSPNSLLGVKGVGELSSIGAPGVIMNAIIDAAGVDHIDKPLTPVKIWSALAGKP